MLQQVAERDQAAENLVGGFQPDDQLGGAVAGGAAGTGDIHDRGPGRFDRVPGGAAVRAGMGFPGRRRDPWRLPKLMQVAD